VLDVDERAWKGKRASGGALPIFYRRSDRAVRGEKEPGGGGVGGVARHMEAGEAMRRGPRERRRTMRAARHGPNRGGAGVSDMWAPTGSRRERERRGTGTCGPAREKEERAEPG
jgi:hypothetical protein